MTAQENGTLRLTGQVQGTEGIVPELLRWRRHCWVEGGYDRPLDFRRQEVGSPEEIITDDVRLEQDASKQAQKPPTGPGGSFNE